MKRPAAVLVILLMVFGVCSLGIDSHVNKAWAAASSNAFERASDDSIFNRVSDWFATVGKPEDEKEAIIAERRADRAAERLGKAFRQESKKANKKMKKFGKEMEKMFE